MITTARAPTWPSFRPLPPDMMLLLLPPLLPFPSIATLCAEQMLMILLVMTVSEQTSPLLSR